MFFFHFITVVVGSCLKISISCNFNLNQILHSTRTSSIGDETSFLIPVSTLFDGIELAQKGIISGCVMCVDIVKLGLVQSIFPYEYEWWAIFSNITAPFSP